MSEQVNPTDEIIKQVKNILPQVHLNLYFLEDFFVAYQTESHLTLKTFYENWCVRKKVNYTPIYNILNQGVLITHLYGLIVYPQQIYKDNIRTKNVTIDKQIWGNYEVLKNEYARRRIDPNNLNDLLEKLRNAISHATVFIDSNMKFHFTDKHEGNHFEVSFEHLELLKFCKEFYNFLYDNEFNP